MSATIYDFKAISAKLRKQRLDDWWQPAKPRARAAGCRAAAQGGGR